MKAHVLALCLTAWITSSAAQTPKATPAKPASAPPAAAAPTPSALASAKSTLTMTRSEGGSMVVPLSSTIKLNNSSNLKRDWYVINDDKSPATLGPTGIEVRYVDGGRSSRGGYEYRVGYDVAFNQPVTAWELRVVVLDVFGRALKTLVSTKVRDASDKVNEWPEWNIYSEPEASKAYASVAYIAYVRLPSGQVYEIDRDGVFRQVRTVASRVTEADLEPPKSPDAPPGR